jgi:predicted RNase H-like nuclease
VRFAGIDGCRGGWIAVTIEGRARRFEILRRFADIARLQADRILVDMPIGLPESGYRASDLAARAMLGLARSRVFLGARRPLLDFSGYDAANLWAKQDGKGLSRQLWNILPKIAEIDRFITPRHQAWLLEAHPELAFLRLSGGRVLSGKKSAEGRGLRHSVLAASGFRELDDWLAQLAGTGAAADDLLDACALALAARRPRRVESPRAVDTRGLAMDIWY